MNRMNKCCVLLAALFTAPFAGPAVAADETEPNDPIAQAQRLSIVAEPGRPVGGATVEAVVGSLVGTPSADVDFYVFEGREGDLVTLDIDGGMGGRRSVDTTMAVLGPGPSYLVLRANDDAGYPLDAGSTHPYDSRITNFRLPATGSYTVGVSSYPRHLRNGGATSSTALNSYSNGDYTLVISGVTAPVLQINIDIKPGNTDEPAPINPKSRGKVPVALLGARDFSVLDVDVASLRFGRAGNEASLSRCGDREDVNRDEYPDRVCHFENQLAGFAATDEEAILKGKLKDGRAFEGRGWLKMVPAKANP